MPINKAIRADNGVYVAYHRAVHLQVDLVANTAVVSVNSHADEQAGLDNLPVAWQWNIAVPVDLLAGDQPTLLAEVEQALVWLDTSPFYQGDIVAATGQSLDALKTQKNDEINRARLRANETYFEFQGQRIACDRLSMLDIQSTNAEISLTGQMPVDPDWPGGWKTMDNTYVPLPDVATWTTFIQAMVSRGIANFEHAQALKAQLGAAQTVEEVAAITW